MPLNTLIKCKKKKNSTVRESNKKTAEVQEKGRGILFHFSILPSQGIYLLDTP